MYFAITLLMLSVCILASQTRHLHSAFSETRYIARAVYLGVFVAVIIGILISDDRLRYKEPARYKYSIYLPLSFGCLVFVNLMFLPKFRLIYNKEQVRGGEAS